MEIVVDTSAILAVIVNEPERDNIIKLVSGNTLIGPGAIPWEIGNAFSAMLKRNRITIEAAQNGMTIFQTIRIRYVSTDFANVLNLVNTTKIYAYDAYFLDCAMRLKSPLLTLDQRLKNLAKSHSLIVLEV